MKLSRFFNWLCILLLMFCTSSVQGTVGEIHANGGAWLVDEHHTFYDGNDAIGFVKISEGFTAEGDLTLNILFPVDGAMTLSDSGVVTLTGNLTLEPDASLPNGGTFSSVKTQTIFLQGNLTIPEGKTLKLTGNIIIDGQGHQLKFEDDAQLIIDGDEGTKVRLRNMQLKGLQDNDSGSSTIEFGDAENQMLTLDNVDVLLADDFTFDGGQLRIKNNVSICGEYAIFQYRAPYDCKILTHSTLFVDLVSGFYYNPSDGKRNHIVMRDSTSRLFLNGCTFYVSGQIGCILKRGHLIVDHNVILRNVNKTTKDYGIIFGNGIANDDLDIDILPGASIDVYEGFLTYRNVY